MDYNKTINLPKTDFPMRAGLPKREPEMLKRWEDMDLYNELLKKNEGKPRFSLHDGPPFSNGSLHMGHALNKSLKDIIVRSYAMRGRYTPYIPGWDPSRQPLVQITSSGSPASGASTFVPAPSTRSRTPHSRAAIRSLCSSPSVLGNAMSAAGPPI